MKTLTAKWLDEHGACYSSLERFRRMFGEECQVTLANATRWLRTDVEWFWSEPRAREDLAWLVLRLVGKRRDGWCGFFSTQLAAAVLRHLGIKKRTDKAYHVMDAIYVLPTHRLVKAVGEIADQSPNI
jgi:hypothetical protein